MIASRHTETLTAFFSALALLVFLVAEAFAALAFTGAFTVLAACFLVVAALGLGAFSFAALDFMTFSFAALGFAAFVAGFLTASTGAFYERTS